MLRLADLQRVRQIGQSQHEVCMPFVQINGVFLYYQIHGRPLRLDSPPLLLIGGLEFALRYPERVAKLILCCTSFGGTRSIPMRWSTLQATLGWGAMSKTMAVRRGLEVATSSAYRDASADELAQIIEWRQSDQMGRGDYVRQVMAGMRFDAARRVHAISAPTLVIHGADDQVVPVANAPLLAQEIPNAQVRIIAGAGHLVFIERAAQVNQAIIEFLGTASPGTAAAVRDVRSAPAAAARSLPRAWQWLRAGLARPMR